MDECGRDQAVTRNHEIEQNVPMESSIHESHKKDRPSQEQHPPSSEVHQLQ
jgi:hypothetical protein